MAVQRSFLVDVADEPGADGNSGLGGIFDLADTPGDVRSLGSGNTQSGTFVLGKRFQRLVDDTVIGTSFPVSVNMESVSAATCEWRAVVQRLNASDVVQATSDVLGPFNTSGIKTGTLTLTTTWETGDRLALSVELRKTGGGGNRSFTLTVNTADSSVDADFESQAVIEEADGVADCLAQFRPIYCAIRHEFSQIQRAQVADAPSGQALFTTIVKYHAITDERMGKRLGNIIDIFNSFFNNSLHSSGKSFSVGAAFASLEIVL